MIVYLFFKNLLQKQIKNFRILKLYLLQYYINRVTVDTPRTINGEH